MLRNKTIENKINIFFKVVYLLRQLVQKNY